MGDPHIPSHVENEHADTRDFIKYANEAAVNLSVATLKGLLLINGGAAVAMLGFVASTVNKDTTIKVDILAVLGTLQWFSWGVASCVLATGLAYVVMYLQAAYVQSFELSPTPPYVASGAATKRYFQLATAFHILAVIVSVGSLVCFLIGTTAVAGILG